MRLTFKTTNYFSFDITFNSLDLSVIDLKQLLESHKGYVKDNIRLFFNGSLLDDKFTLTYYGVHDEDVLIFVNFCRLQSKQVENSVFNEFEEEDEENVKNGPGGNIVEYIDSIVNEEINPIEEENKEEGTNEQEGNLLENIASIVKVMTSSNSSDVQNIISTLNENHPEMIDLITENEQEFKNLISQPITQQDIILYKHFLGEDVENEGENSVEFNEEEPIQNDEQNDVVEENNNEETEINLSKIDYDAVQRLRILGFNEIDACQAYFAFDKNEDLAAEFLYENKNEDDVFINYENNINQSENFNNEEEANK